MRVFRLLNTVKDEILLLAVDVWKRTRPLVLDVLVVHVKALTVSAISWAVGYVTLRWFGPVDHETAALLDSVHSWIPVAVFTLLVVVHSVQLVSVWVLENLESVVISWQRFLHNVKRAA